MSVFLNVMFIDVNGLEANTGFYIDSAANAVTVVTAIKAITNAKIVSAEIQTPIGIQLVTNNDAVAANVETAKTKAKIRMRGADLGSTARPFAFATVSIPAPIGTLINGLSGDVTNPDVDGVKSHVLSASGVTMSTVERIYYGH
jgi:hypothetical protein